MKRLSVFSIFLFFIGFFNHAFGQNDLIICGKKNDISDILVKNGYRFVQEVDPLKAVIEAKVKGGIIFMADNYPQSPLKLSERVFSIAKKKKLRLFIEFPFSIPGLSINHAVNKIKRERVIVNTRMIKGLDSLALLSIHSNYFVNIHDTNPLLVLGTVAGLNQAEFGFSDVPSFPILTKKDDLLIASTRFSNCITSRFDPGFSWNRIWTYILGWLSPGKEWYLNYWPQEVQPSIARYEQISKSSIKSSIDRGSEWFYNSKLIVDSSWEKLVLKRTAPSGKGVVYPLVDSCLNITNGNLGILEGNASVIENNGTQPARWWIRSDCQSGTAEALAMSAKYLNKTKFETTARNLLNYLYIHSNLRNGNRGDSNSPSFGLIGWATTDPDAYYGDDNARVILNTIGASVALETHEWDKYIIEAIMGNFRTAGRLGYRGNWFRDSTIQRLGWRKLHERNIINIHPHYESWLWACYLWLYDKTGYKPLLQESKIAIKIAMKSYPNWKWTNGIQQERARMILPLSWLVRIENTPKHRKWLRKVSQDLLVHFKDGAIPEELGKNANGKYGFINSNSEYGTREAPLISKKGDPVADLLYTMNFGFFSLNEEASATNNAEYLKKVKKISDFLIRIQAESKSHPELDGAWFRAFNFKEWNYWASNADADWGAVCTETGWIQSWVLTTLILVQDKSNFWDYSKRFYTKDKRFGKMAHITINKMMTNSK